MASSPQGKLSADSFLFLRNASQTGYFTFSQALGVKDAGP